MANKNLSPSLIAKLKIKETVNRMKNKSPQLQEVLRQRCRERMRERRGQIFNRRRLISDLVSDEMEHNLTNMMCQEIDNLTNMRWQQPIENSSLISDDLSTEEVTHRMEMETCTDGEQWLLEEIDRMLQDEIEWIESLYYEDNEEVTCPICQKYTLIEILDSVDCKACGLHLANDIKTIKNLIDNCINRHSINCKAVPGFTMLNENESNSLYMTCGDCSSMTCVV